MTNAQVGESAISKVLVAVDFSAASDAAFEAAVSLCKKLDAALFILHVAEWNDPSVDHSTTSSDENPTCRAARSSLDRLQQKALSRGLSSCNSELIFGTPSLKILEVIKCKGIQLVVMGTKPPHGLERLIFGSTAKAIFRGTSCPVLTVDSSARQQRNEMIANGPIVFATDFHATTADAIVYAGSMSIALGLPLHCLHVLPRSMESEGPGCLIPGILLKALQHLACTRAPLAVNPVCAIEYGSEVSNTVVSYAKQHNAALIVMGVRQSSMAVSHLPAHITYRIVIDAPCPVLTVAFAYEEYQALISACV